MWSAAVFANAPQLTGHIQDRAGPAKIPREEATIRLPVYHSLVATYPAATNELKAIVGATPEAVRAEVRQHPRDI